jgi:alcohol dehydrogenase class IV
MSEQPFSPGAESAATSSHLLHVSLLHTISKIPRLVVGPCTAIKLPEWVSETVRDSGGGTCAILVGARFFERGEYPQLVVKMILKDMPKAPIFHVANEPSDLLIDEMIAKCRRLGNVRAVVSIGGGSVLDAGKALAAMLCEDSPTKEFLEGVGTRKPSGKILPWFAAPTTAGTGSEAATNAVLSRPGPNGFKRSLRHPSYKAAGVALDPKLMERTPRAVIAASGMDALTQLIESWSSMRVPAVLAPVLEEAIVLVYQTLPVAVRDAPNLKISDLQRLLIGAFVSGVGLSTAGLGTTHGLAGTIGALTNAPHGIVCARLMAPALRETLNWLEAHAEQSEAANALANFERLGKRLASDSGCAWRTPFDQMLSWADAFKIPTLREFGLDEDRIAKVVANGSDRNSPAALGASVWRKILQEAIG